MRFNWTDEKIQMLKDGYQTMKLKELREALGATNDVIYSMMSKLGMQLKKVCDKSEEIINELSSYPDYNLIGYKSNSNLTLRHSCGNEFKTTRKRFFYQGQMCPNCLNYRRIETNLKKYGTEYPMQSESIKNKTATTNMERYGVKTTLLVVEVMDKIKATTMKVYGVENANQCEIVKERKKRTNMEHYGVEYSLGAKEVRESISDTVHKQYYENLLENKEVKPLFKFSEYKGNGIYHEFKCVSCGYEFDFMVGGGRVPICRKCYPITTCSKPEMELKEIYPQAEFNERFYYNDKKHTYKELDLYFKDKNIGVELDGIYWHSELAKENKFNLLDKSNFFKDKGIQVLHFFDTEWNDKRNIVKSIMNSKLGATDKIYARKCDIKEIDSCENFLNENHLQGNVNASVKIGLFYNSELVSVMTLGKPRYNKNYEWELLRLASKLNTTIVGGASKMLQYFIKTYKPNSILSYADARYSNGGVYESLGFKYIETSSPNYFYFKSGMLESRIKYQKHKQENLLKEFSKDLTEWENMQANGFNIIYDCGNLVYGWKNVL